MSNDASSADDASPVSDAEASWLFRALGPFPAFVVAVSGGPDSTALMLLLARWRSTCEQPPKLVAVTVDHGLRPESKREAKAVARLADKLGIEHKTLRWTGRKPKTGLQEAARRARYRLLAAEARRNNARHVLTAHTLDDQAETVLFRLMRGSGVGGLAGMHGLAPVPLPLQESGGVMLVRPLLEIPKARLIATLKAAKVPYADDRSNRDPRFSRPRLRAMMPLLAREGLTPARLATLARRVRRVEDMLFEALNDAQAAVAPGAWPSGGPVAMEREAFSGLPDEIAMRLLERAIAWAGDEGPVELAKLEALYAAMTEPLNADMLHLDHAARFRRTLAGAAVTIEGDRITVERAPPRGKRPPKRLTTRPHDRRKRRKPR